MSVCIILIKYNLKFVLRIKNASKLRGAGHCTSARCMSSILRHVAEAFPLAKLGQFLNNHRVVATNTSMVLNSALPTQ